MNVQKPWRAAARRRACAAARAALRAQPRALWPQQRDNLGRPLHVAAAAHQGAYLQAELHAPFLFRFFLRHFGAPSPPGPVRLRVYTRWDAPLLPPVEVELHAGRLLRDRR